MSRKVVKFGGTSLSCAAQIKKAGGIIKEEEGRQYVVVSAPGKRWDGDIKVTDLLYRAYDLAQAGRPYEEMMQQICGRYREIVTGLGLSEAFWKEWIQEFEAVCVHLEKENAQEYIVSRGEYLNGKIVAQYLGFAFVDAAKIICFDKNGEFLHEKTRERLKAVLKDRKFVVVPGFYGADDAGAVHTFSRGGSDITGSLVAEAVQADIYENWTDVSGFLAADPRVVENPKLIRILTYRELRELAYMGAVVMHEEAVLPLHKTGIPIQIKNTNAPGGEGTMIVGNTCQESEFTITGIAGKKGFAAVTIEKDRMNSEIGFGRKVLEVFQNHGISFEHVPSGIDTMTVFVKQEALEEKKEKILSEIYEATGADSVEVETGLSLLAVVGRGMKEHRGTAGKIFTALAHADVNVKMIDQGSSELNIIIGVADEEFERAVRAVYGMFVAV